MNKTIIININGIVFHIEEDAYEVLRNYMSEVKRHFAYTPDHEEIVTDIENRLAEMFSERLAADGKQVIFLTDVEQIIAQMGSVTDFENSDDESGFVFPKIDKKLFRDPEDRMIGGVCSGIGHYLDIEARWVRLFMLLIVFLGGSGIMVYAILWIVIPTAKTRSDRMAMKGEPINLQNFKRSFDEEIGNVRQGLKRVHHEASPALSNMGNSFISVSKILLKILGAILIFVESMILLALIIGLTVVLGLWTSADVGPFPQIVEPQYRSLLAFGIFLAVSIPLIALIFFEIRLLFNRKVLGKSGAFFLLMLWLAGLGVSAYYGTKTGMQFSEEASFSEVVPITPMPVYYLKLNTEKHLTRQDSINYNISSSEFKNRKIINIRSRDFDESNIDISVERSDLDKPTLTQQFSSRGSSFESALKSAQAIRYHFKQTDSVLYFDKTINIGHSLYRAQEVDLTLRIPQNTRLIIVRELNPFINHYNLWDCIPENSPKNTPSEWVMTESGLKCITDTTFKSGVNPQ